jgi:hypothetical protein
MGVANAAGTDGAVIGEALQFANEATLLDRA